MVHQSSVERSGLLGYHVLGDQTCPSPMHTPLLSLCVWVCVCVRVCYTSHKKANRLSHLLRPPHTLTPDNAMVWYTPQASITMSLPNKLSTTLGSFSSSSSLCPNMPLSPQPHVYRSHAPAHRKVKGQVHIIMCRGQRLKVRVRYHR